MDRADRRRLLVRELLVFSCSVIAALCLVVAVVAHSMDDAWNWSEVGDYIRRPVLISGAVLGSGLYLATVVIRRALRNKRPGS